MRVWSAVRAVAPERPAGIAGSRPPPVRSQDLRKLDIAPYPGKANPSAALEGRRDNPVWRELLGRAGGPTLKLPLQALHTCVRIAALDKRIQDEAWRNLEPGRKELLLPLRSEAALREGAQHVTAMKLTYRDTKAYVRAHLPAKTKAKKKTGTTAIVRTVSGVKSKLADAPFRRSLLAAFAKADTTERAAVKEEMVALRDLVVEILADLRATKG